MRNISYSLDEASNHPNYPYAFFGIKFTAPNKIKAVRFLNNSEEYNQIEDLNQQVTDLSDHKIQLENDLFTKNQELLSLEQEFNQEVEIAITNERNKWDVNKDGKKGLPEAIDALREIITN